MSNEKFGFRDAKEIDIGYARVLCIRITYVGELGYELYVPSEQAVHVYNKIMEVNGDGGEFGLKHAGLKALGSLRLEKGYRDFGHDMDNTDTLLQVGLGFTVDNSHEFIGKEIVAEEKRVNKARGGMTKRLLQVLVATEGENDQCLLHHGEIVRRNGLDMGEIRVGGYGHTLEGPIGLFMCDTEEHGGGGDIINKKFIEDGEWTVQIGNEIRKIGVSIGPMFDPKNVKIKS